MEHQTLLNRPFYGCLLGDLVIEWQRGWRWPCFDTDLTAICFAGTHEGVFSRSTLLQHAPGAKLPRLHQRLLAKKYVAQQTFCSRVLLPHIKLVWYEGAGSRGKSVVRFCFRSKLSRVYWLGYLPGSVFRERVTGASSFVCTGWGSYPGTCYRSKLSRVYWLGFLPGSVFRERVSGASSLVCTGLIKAAQNISA